MQMLLSTLVLVVLIGIIVAIGGMWIAAAAAVAWDHILQRTKKRYTLSSIFHTTGTIGSVL